MATPKVLYLLVEAGDKTYWNRAGVAFENSDVERGLTTSAGRIGSYNVKLDLFPGLTFNLRDPKHNGEEIEPKTTRRKQS